MNKQKYFCFMIVLFPAFIETALALSCYQCDSTLDSNCQEMWDSSLSYNQQKYRTCNMWNAQFCIKVTGMWGAYYLNATSYKYQYQNSPDDILTLENINLNVKLQGVVGTHRFCSSRDLGDQCQDIWFPDHDRMYRACIYTCTGDGCNSAVKWSTAPALIVGLFSAVIAVLRLL